MSQQPTDRNLLVALLALQMGFLTRSMFLDLVRDWIDDRERPIESLIRKRQLLDAATLDLVMALVAKHLELHDGSVEKSLEALSSIGDVRQELMAIDSREFAPTIQFLVPHKSSDSSANPHDSESPTPLVQTEASNAGTGRFRVLRFHAEGGLGKVSVAHDAELNRDVALKEIKPKYAHDFENRARFMVEAEITGALEHPGIVPVYSLGQYADGRPYYAMRFIRGDSLKTAVAALHERDKKGWPPGDRQLELRRLLARLIDVCDAVSYAHSRGVLHRDLKPGNIMLGRYGETLVVDWGLAKSVGRSSPTVSTDEATVVPRSGDSSATQAGTLVGTPGYMSPEQAEGRLDLLGPATDVYSLGATLYTILAGQPTFTHSELSTFPQRVAAGDFPKPSFVKPGLIPPALEAICLKALATKPEDRYPIARALADDLERWLADEPVSVFREPWPDRFARTVRNHRTKFVGLTTVVASTAIALVIIVALVSQKNRELTKARDAEHAQFLTAQREQRRAERNLEVARTRATRLLKYSEDLARIPGLGSVRLKVADESLKTLQDLAAQQDADRQLDLELATALRTWANLTQPQNLRDSLDANQRAVEILRRHLTETPEDMSLNDFLALTLQDQGNLQKRVGDYTTAIERFEEALQIVASLRKKSPETWDYRRTEGVCRLSFGSLLVQTTRVQDAVRELDAASRLLQEIQSNPKRTALDWTLLKLAWITQVEALRKAGRLQDSEQVAIQAVNSARRAPKGDSNDDFVLANLQFELSRTLLAMGTRDRDAMSTIDAGLESARNLVSAYPDSARINTYRLLLARLGAQRAALSSRKGETDSARNLITDTVKHIEELVSLEEPPTSVREAHAEILWIAAKVDKANGDLNAYRQHRSRARVICDEILKRVPLHEDVRKQLQEMDDDSTE